MAGKDDLDNEQFELAQMSARPESGTGRVGKNRGNPLTYRPRYGLPPWPVCLPPLPRPRPLPLPDPVDPAEDSRLLPRPKKAPPGVSRRRLRGGLAGSSSGPQAVGNAELTDPRGPGAVPTEPRAPVAEAGGTPGSALDASSSDPTASLVASPGLRRLGTPDSLDDGETLLDLAVAASTCSTNAISNRSPIRPGLPAFGLAGRSTGDVDGLKVGDVVGLTTGEARFGGMVAGGGIEDEDEAAAAGTLAPMGVDAREEPREDVVDDGGGVDAGGGKGGGAASEPGAAAKGEATTAGAATAVPTACCCRARFFAFFDSGGATSVSVASGDDTPTPGRACDVLAIFFGLSCAAAAAGAAAGATGGTP